MNLADSGHVINYIEVINIQLIKHINYKIIYDDISYIKSHVIKQASVSNRPYEVKLEVLLFIVHIQTAAFQSIKFFYE